mmetsp:Transcript_73371/g.202497  ORF Transcript_73371/g.202497 Transcript_73371/m.202497 type:complete len:225 (-) Transcript_73371:2027-2701(-)
MLLARNEEVARWVVLVQVPGAQAVHRVGREPGAGDLPRDLRVGDLCPLVVPAEHRHEPDQKKPVDHEVHAEGCEDPRKDVRGWKPRVLGMQGMVLEDKSGRQAARGDGRQRLHELLACIRGEPEAGDGPQHLVVVEQNDVNVRDKEGREHLYDVCAREEEGQDRYRPVEQDVGVAREVHGAAVGEAPLGLEAPHRGVGAHQQLHDVARQPDGEDRLQQEGDEVC